MMERMTRRASVLFTVLVAVVATGCGGSEPVDRAAPSPSPTVALTPSPAPASPSPVPAPDRPAGVDAISHQRYLPMWNRPRSGDADFVFDAKNPGGGLAPMLVESRRTIHDQRWLQILLPIRPNGSSAWAHAEDVKVVPRDEEIVVDLSRRTLRHYVDGELEDHFKVGVGQPQYPTGVGTFYVWQRVPFSDPYGPYGIFALGLSGFSPVLSDWPGGGRMAIHGTSDPSDLGRQVSHGCVRVYNEDLRDLLDVRLGTPVVIRA